MRMHSTTRSFMFVIFCLGIFVLAGCGQGSTASTSASPASTATPCPTPTNPFRTGQGKVQSVSGNTLAVTTNKGTQVTVSLTAKTRYQRQVALQPTELKLNTMVIVAVKSNPDKTYTATMITVRNVGGNGSGRGGFGGGANGTPAPCSRFGTGSGRNGGNGIPGTGLRGLVGSVSQVTDKSLVITEANGSDYTVAIDAGTRIFEVQTAGVSDIKQGSSISFTGTGQKASAITAVQVTILLTSSTTTAA